MITPPPSNEPGGLLELLIILLLVIVGAMSEAPRTPGQWGDGPMSEQLPREESWAWDRPVP